MSTQILFSKSKVSTPKMTSESIIDKKSHGHEIGDIPRCIEAEHIDKTPNPRRADISRKYDMDKHGKCCFWWQNPI